MIYVKKKEGKMSTDSYSQYKIYENPDYFADKEEAEEKWEEWWLDRIKDEGGEE